MAKEWMSGGLRDEQGKETLAKTREEVTRGWAAISQYLIEQGDQAVLADLFAVSPAAAAAYD